MLPRPASTVVWRCRIRRLHLFRGVKTRYDASCWPWMMVRRSLNKFPDLFVWELLLIVHTWNSSPLWSNLRRLQCTSGRPHGSPLVWKCQWPSSQTLPSPQLSHNDSLWAKRIIKSHREQSRNYREVEELSWCPSWSNSLRQGWSCGLFYCPGRNATEPIWRVLPSSDGISSLTPLKPKYSNPNPNPLANQLWCIDILTLPTALIIPDRFLPSWNLLCHSKTDARFMQGAPKAIWSIPYVSVAFFPNLK